jgi:hypothetical protein
MHHSGVKFASSATPLLRGECLPAQFTIASAGALKRVEHAFSFQVTTNGLRAPMFRVYNGVLPNGISLDAGTPFNFGIPIVPGLDKSSRSPRLMNRPGPG